jgi:hypothetical protein
MVAVSVLPVAAIVRKQGQIVAQFRAAGATSADCATTAAALGVREGHALTLLRGHAVLQEAGEGRLFVDGARWDALLKKRRRAALVSVAVGACIVLGIIVTWATTR